MFFTAETCGNTSRRLCRAVIRGTARSGDFAMRSNGFHPPVDADGEYKEFYDRLGSLYSAIRQDLHVENNILFSRVAQMEAALLH